MPIIPLVCPFCSGNAQIDSDMEIAKCPFCEREFVVRDAIVNNYITNVTNNITNINADTVNFYSKKDFIIETGVLKQYLGEEVDIVIPDSVYEIAPCVFRDLPIHSVVFPEHTAVIGESAFQGCSSLTSVELPKGIKKIGKNAFAACRSLRNVSNIPDNKVVETTFGTPFCDAFMAKQIQSRKNS